MEHLEQRVLSANNELFLLQEKKRQAESKFLAQKAELGRGISKVQIEVRMMELRLRDRDHALRTAWLREKELK